MSVVDRRIERIAAAQHGAFNIDQARNAGVTHSIVRNRINAGAWRRELQGVYTLTVFPRTWEQHLMVGVLSKPGASVGHRSAAAHRGLAGFRRGRLELVVPPDTNHLSPIATIHRSATIETTKVAGIPTTTIHQTLFDVAGVVSYAKLLGAAEAAILDRVLTIDELGDRLLELTPATPRGIGDMRAVIGELGRAGYVPAQTELERLMLPVVEAFGVPVVRQASFPWRAPHPMTVDAFVPSWGLITEADGRRWHTRVADFERDTDRDNVAAAHGIHVMRFTYHRLTREIDRVFDLLETYRRTRSAA